MNIYQPISNCLTGLSDEFFIKHFSTGKFTSDFLTAYRIKMIDLCKSHHGTDVHLRILLALERVEDHSWTDLSCQLGDLRANFNLTNSL